MVLADAAVVGWAHSDWLRGEFVSGIGLGLLFGYAYVAVVLLGDSVLFRGGAAPGPRATQPDTR